MTETTKSHDLELARRVAKIMGHGSAAHRACSLYDVYARHGFKSEIKKEGNRWLVKNP